MVAIALALMLGAVLIPAQSDKAEAADPVKILPPNPPVLNQAKHLIEKGDPESAATVLRRFLTTTPPPEHLDDTYLLLGAALYGMRMAPSISARAMATISGGHAEMNEGL